MTFLSLRARSVHDVSGWVWLLVWWLLLAFQMAYGKHLTDATAAELSQHERVFWTNALGFPPTVCLFLLMGEAEAARRAAPTAPALFWLALSWTLGIGISYTGWRLKEQVSATTFTLVGVVNKMATIALSALAFPGSTSARGGCALVLCILFGMAYRDAPMRVPHGHGPSGRGSSKARDSSYALDSAHHHAAGAGGAGAHVDAHVVIGGGEYALSAKRVSV